MQAYIFTVADETRRITANSITAAKRKATIHTEGVMGMEASGNWFENEEDYRISERWFYTDFENRQETALLLYPAELEADMAQGELEERPPLSYEIPKVAEVDQPLYKIEQKGAEGTSDEELLATILRPENDEHTLAEMRRILQRNPMPTLQTATFDSLEGINNGQRAMILAAIEFGRRATQTGFGFEPAITSPADVIPELRDIKDSKKEHFVVVFLNARNQVISREHVSTGSLNASLVHPREVFVPAVGTSAASVILAHNHPSGDVTPSREDIELTRRMVQAGEIMGIEVLDHLIVAAERFLSMKEANVF